MQVNPTAGVTFATGLRACMRLDPDVILVGEIRDAETAQIGTQAALTGHLVLSSVHANDTVSTIIRMIDLGVEPFLIGSSLLAVVAQRLVRKICPDCKKPFRPEKSVLEKFGLPQDQIFWRGSGCSSCMRSGYKGRTGVFEILVMDGEIRRLLTSGADSVTIKEVAVKRGMTTLFDDGLSKVRKGLTTLDEVMRVTQE